MGLDLSKLQNVQTAAGKTTARCPACAAAGGDAKGDHLVIYPDSGYGCVANPKDKTHTKEIFRLVGLSSREGSTSKISVRAVNVPASSVLVDLKGFARFKVPPAPCPQTTPPSAEMRKPVVEEKPPRESEQVPVLPVDGDEAPPLAEDVGSQEVAPPLCGNWVDMDGRLVSGVPSERSSFGQSPWEFLGVSEESFYAAGTKPVPIGTVC